MSETRQQRTDHPQDWEVLEDDVVSNFDGHVDTAVAEKLKTGMFIAGFPAADFHATCWFEDGEYWACVRRFKQVVGIYSADDVDQLRSTVCAEHGWE